MFVAGVAIAILVCDDLRNTGSRSAAAFEFKVEDKPTPSSGKTFFKAEARDPTGWLSLKLDGILWDVNSLGAPTWDRSTSFDAAQIVPKSTPSRKERSERQPHNSRHVGRHGALDVPPGRF